MACICLSASKQQQADSSQAAASPFADKDNDAMMACTPSTCGNRAGLHIADVLLQLKAHKDDKGYLAQAGAADLHILGPQS